MSERREPIERTDITVPADPRQVRVLRMVVAGTLSLRPIPGDIVEDVRAAVDESCALVLGRDGVVGRLTLTLHCGPDRVDATVHGTFDGPPRRPVEDHENAELLLRVFVDDYRIDLAHDRIGFTKALDGSSELGRGIGPAG